jgi:outer membrane protein assembly factor BamB
MTHAQTNEPAPRKPLRLWPGLLAVALQWLGRYIVPAVFPEAALYGIIGGVVLGLVVVLWWLFFSRAPWSERVGAIVVLVVGLFATSRVVHESIATGGQGVMLYIIAIPVLSLTLVAWAVASRRLSTGARRASMVASLLFACGVFALLRTGGISGDGDPDLHWRWSRTPEERLLASEPVALPPAPAAPAAAPEKDLTVPAASPALPAVASAVAKTSENGAPAPADDGPSAHPPDPNPASTKTAADWPGFRGPERDDIVRGVRIDTDWSRKPPVELWRRPIGPGWSSFAVHGNLLYTQEQRGDDEVVSAYNLTTGEPVWRHRDAVRFWESNAGAGPRGTPTLGNGRVYTFGATGILNALDARDGSLVWSRNVASDTGEEAPGWGFSSSPLVMADIVVIAAGGTLAAYDLASGKPRWVGPAGGMSYSSPHGMTIDGVAQIVLLNGGGATSVGADGTVLWQHQWPESSGSIAQPVLTSDGDVLIGSIDFAANGFGTRRIAVAHGPGGWTVKERWTTTGLKPAFNDYVVHKGHAYGFDGSILASVDLEDGRRAWKGGRYGHGQLLLLADEDVLLVLSEDGELALVRAAPDKFTELARVPALNAKTWNHPVLVGDVLLVRNGEEMAAFRLSLAGH